MFLSLIAIVPTVSLPKTAPSSSLVLKMNMGIFFLLHSISISCFTFSEASAASKTSAARFRFNSTDTAVFPTSTILPFCANRSKAMTFSLFNLFDLLNELFIELAIDRNTKRAIQSMSFES